MADNKHMRITGVDNVTMLTECAKIFICLRDKKGYFKTVANKAHIVPGLPCDIIAVVELLKPNNISIEWGKEGKKDCVQFRGKKFSVKTTAVSLPVVHQEVSPTPVFDKNLVFLGTAEELREPTDKGKIAPILSEKPKVNFSSFSSLQALGLAAALAEDLTTPTSYN